MRFVDLEGTQVEVDEDSTKENIWDKFLRFMGLLSETNYRYEQQDIENDIDMLENSPEMKGVEILSKEIDKVKTRTVKGIDKVHDIAATTSGVAAIGALSSSGTPLSPVLTTTSSVSGLVSAMASGLNWGITGDSKYRNNFIYEMGTIGIGAGARTIKAGKTLTVVNAKILQQIYKNSISGIGWGISLIQ